MDGPFLKGYPAAYNGEDVAFIENSPRPWQAAAMKMISNPPEGRLVLWFFDPTGRSGKTSLAKYLCYKGKAHHLGWDNEKDAAYARAKNRYKRVVIFQLVRTCPKTTDINSLYSTIEKIKDGLIFSGKWESTDVITTSPHVFCFANTLPDPQKLSKDRWVISRIQEEDQKMHVMSLEERNDLITNYWEWFDANNPEPEISLPNGKQLHAEWKKNKFEKYPRLWKESDNEYKPSKDFVNKYNQSTTSMLGTSLGDDQESYETKIENAHNNSIDPEED